MKASELSLDSQSSILMKGPWGHSKTCSAATFALEGPIWIAYWDKKKPLELYHFFHKVLKRPDLLNRIDIDIYGSHNANDYLNKLMEFTQNCRYVAIITDSVTNLTASAVNWSMGFRETKKKKEKDLKVIPDWDEYKVETSIVTQALDICRMLPCHNIWTAHPLPGIKVEGSGSSVKVTKVNPIVSYGSKVAGIVPGQFSEIYHFSKLADWDQAAGKSRTKFIVDTEAIGDDFAKSNLGLKVQLDITDRPFYTVWKEAIKNLKEEINAIKEETAPMTSVNPFSTPQVNANQPQINQPTKKWNSEKGEYE